jgi:hypothetical protein
VGFRISRARRPSYARLKMSGRPPERARYLVELAAPEAGWDDLERILRRARAAANGANGGTRLLRSIFVPEDSRFYLLYEAASAADARLAAAEAELAVAGISEALKNEEE